MYLDIKTETTSGEDGYSQVPAGKPRETKHWLLRKNKAGDLHLDLAVLALKQCT